MQAPDGTTRMESVQIHLTRECIYLRETTHFRQRLAYFLLSMIAEICGGDVHLLRRLALKQGIERIYQQVDIVDEIRNSHGVFRHRA